MSTEIESLLLLKEDMIKSKALIIKDLGRSYSQIRRCKSKLGKKS